MTSREKTILIITGTAGILALLLMAYMPRASTFSVPPAVAIPFYVATIVCFLIAAYKRQKRTLAGVMTLIVFALLIVAVICFAVASANVPK